MSQECSWRRVSLSLHTHSQHKTTPVSKLSASMKWLKCSNHRWVLSRKSSRNVFSTRSLHTKPKCSARKTPTTICNNCTSHCSLSCSRSENRMKSRLKFSRAINSKSQTWWESTRRRLSSWRGRFLIFKRKFLRFRQPSTSRRTLKSARTGLSLLWISRSAT